TNFAEYIRLKVEKTLEARLGRDVSIRKATFIRGRTTKVILDDIRIANAPGAVNPYFATVRQVEITGGIDSFWGRRVRVGRVDIRTPRLFFEVFPAGAQLTHNFPRWQPPKRGKYEIYRLDLGRLFITEGGFEFLDRRHDIAATAVNISSQVQVTSAEGLYAGVMNSPRLRLRIQEYLPLDLEMRGGFRYTPGVLALQSIALRGRGVETFLSGRLDPLTEGVYDLNLRSLLALERVREVFKLEKVLEGSIALDGKLRGKQGDFTIAGKWSSPKISADVYDLTALRGDMEVTEEGAKIGVETARYGGGTIAAGYVLPTYAEPYPMSVDLRYNSVSLEKVLGDWGIERTGLRGAATGRLEYRWNKDKLLDGSGEGTARLARNAVAFSDAKYPIPLAGSADFSLNRGVVTFRRADLVTEASKIAFTGTLRIEDANTNLRMRIESSDFSELDRVAYNFAHSAGKQTFTLLGLGGSGRITGTVQGPIKAAQVVAQINSSGTQFNDVLLGEADIALRYDGRRGTLEFDRALFRDGGGQLALKGTVSFPDRGPSPRFDLAVDANGYPVERAMSVVKLPFQGIRGTGTGRLIVTGTPESGKVTFSSLTIRQADTDAELRLGGDVVWMPGKGNVHFDLDLAARSFPVADIATFLDFADLPVSGELTGTLHLEGTKQQLEGAGAVTIRKGTLYGEPVDLATADIVFTEGKLRATNVDVTSPAGRVTGEAEIDLNTQKFSYSIRESTLDLTKLKILSSLAGLLGGNVTITSAGAGTFDQPELVVEATWNQPTVSGITLPSEAPPKLYLAIRNGRLVIRGSAADVLTVEGEGTVGENLAVDGLVKITVSDLARLVKFFPATATLPASGNLVAELRLGGRLSPLEALIIDGTFPVFDVQLSEHKFTAPQPLRFGLRDGRLMFDQFELAREGSTFAVTGFAEVTGAKRLNVSIRGNVEAALLQLFVSDLRADGDIDVAATVTGTLDNPRIEGTAEFEGAQMKFAGFPQLIDDLSGRLKFEGDEIVIESVRATVGGGSVIAGGSIMVDGLMPKSVAVTLEGRQVAIRYYEGLTIEGDFDLVLRGDAERARLQGDINVSRALFFRDIDFTQSILNVVLSRRGVTPVVAATWQDRVSLDLQIRSDDTLAVQNNIADVSGSADLQVTGTLGNPVILGTVTLNEGGTVRFQNIDYRLVRGTINFQNPFRIDPYFDVTVEGRVSGTFSEMESGPIDVTVNLTGTLDRFTPTITSEPPASDITLFSLLGFGGLSRQTGQTAGGGTVGLFGQSLLQQGLSGLLGPRIFPFVDSFTFDPGLLDTSGDPGQKVTLERRLSNNLRLLLIYNVTSGKNRALVEWQANPEWTIQFLRDEIRREWRAEARFRRRYAAHWTFGGNRQPVTLVAGNGPLTGTIPAEPQEEQPNALRGTGPPVIRIEYRADAPFDQSVLARHVEVARGLPLSVREVQASIKNLFATADFRDIRVRTDPAEGGIVVTFVLSINYRVETVEIKGLRGADLNRAQRLLNVRVGEVLSLNAADRSATALRNFLNRNGYLEATVDPDIRFTRATSRADVKFDVIKGPRATVGEVVIEGNISPFTTQELIGRMRRGPGRAFRLEDARRSDAERMKTYMVRRDHRKADVDFQEYTYDAASKRVNLRYTATAGPLVKVEVQGVDRSAVRRVIPFRRNQAYSEDVIDQAADNIIKLYQQRGHIDAAVDTESRLKNNVWTTTFNVQPGQKYKLAALTFSGNASVPDDKLAEIVTTSARGGGRSFIARIFRRPSGVTREQLSEDRDALESYYRLNGFSEAKVGTPVVNTNPNGTMTVDFPITEGIQTIVTEVSIEGNEQVPADALPKPQLKRGEPLNPQTLRTDLVALQSFYADRGNAEVQVTPRPEISDDKRSAKVTYLIAEGPRVHIDDVIVRGNTYTRSRLIVRKSDLDERDPFSYTSILEAQRNLYRLGIFSRVEVQPEQTGTSVSDRNVTIQVEEGKNLTVAGALGVTKQVEAPISPLISASVAHRNLFGTGRYLGLEVIKSRERNEAFLTFREPFIFNLDIPLQLTVFQSDERRRAAHLVQRGMYLEASKVARYQTRWSARYEY
ncbi:MAG TPA: translocation/assembly module TamB domain-containing protein, partial [Thermoanaerobaculia bacterium]|nr:translocation/assembly module TamB domain-containing protein [Thermoanaerobaculia bacterium]